MLVVLGSGNHDVDSPTRLIWQLWLDGHLFWRRRRLRRRRIRTCMPCLLLVVLAPVPFLPRRRRLLVLPILLPRRPLMMGLPLPFVTGGLSVFLLHFHVLSPLQDFLLQGLAVRHCLLLLIFLDIIGLLELSFLVFLSLCFGFLPCPFFIFHSFLSLLLSLLFLLLSLGFSCPFVFLFNFLPFQFSFSLSSLILFGFFPLAIDFRFTFLLVFGFLPSAVGLGFPFLPLRGFPLLLLLTSSCLGLLLFLLSLLLLLFLLFWVGVLFGFVIHFPFHFWRRRFWRITCSSGWRLFRHWHCLSIRWHRRWLR